MPSKDEKANVCMQIAISLGLFVFGVIVLTAPNWLFPQAFDPGVKQMAAGWIGAVVGYWLS